MRIPGTRAPKEHHADASTERPRRGGDASATNARDALVGPFRVTIPKIQLGGREIDVDVRGRFGRRGKSSRESRDGQNGALDRLKDFGGKIKGLGNFQQNLMTNMAVKVIAGVSGTLSGLLLAGLAYKVVGGYQDEIKEARREVSRQNQERKARLAQVRRLLSGPLRAAARDLKHRLDYILRTPPRRRVGEPPKIRANYFSAHYPDNPNEAVNSTLFRLCRYLHWVEQFQRGVQMEGVSEQDTWQYALDQQLDRVAHELEVSTDRYDATMPTERLTEVFAAVHIRACGLEEDEKSQDKKKHKSSIFLRIDSSLNEDETYFSKESLEERRIARVPRRSLLSIEPQERLSRFPMRLFRDTQVALAEVFGKLHTLESGGEHAQSQSQVNPHMLYTEFVMKLEEAQMLYEQQLMQGGDGGMDEMTLAAQQENLQADPWFRWMLPLQLQIRRLAMLQSQTSKLLTRKEARELLAARARLRGVLDGLDGLLSVLERRLDDPLFNKSKHNLKKKNYFATKAEQKRIHLSGVKRQKALDRWNKLKQAIPYTAKFRRLPPPPTKQSFYNLLSNDKFKTFIRRYKRRATAGVVSAICTAVVGTVLSSTVNNSHLRRTKAAQQTKDAEEARVEEDEQDEAENEVHIRAHIK